MAAPIYMKKVICDEFEWPIKEIETDEKRYVINKKHIFKRDEYILGKSLAIDIYEFYIDSMEMDNNKRKNLWIGDCQYMNIDFYKKVAIILPEIEI